jgi:hypothetical protein
VTLRFTEKADKDYARMPPAIRKAFAKQLPACQPQSSISACQEVQRSTQRLAGQGDANAAALGRRPRNMVEVTDQKTNRPPTVGAKLLS